MIQRNKYITLRYVLNSVFSKNVPEKTTKPQKPNASDYEGGTDSPEYQDDLKEYNLKYDQYRQGLRQPTYVTDTVVSNEENLSDQIRFYVEEISYNFEVGNAMFTGLTNADLINWYIKPVSISLKGVSVISANAFLGSDNIVLDIYKKIQEYLSEVNYNYFKKPRFRMVVENGLQGLDNFQGVITSFNFSENAKLPDTYAFDLKFIGKPINDEKRADAKKYKTQSDSVKGSTTATETGKIVDKKP